MNKNVHLSCVPLTGLSRPGNSDHHDGYEWLRNEVIVPCTALILKAATLRDSSDLMLTLTAPHLDSYHMYKSSFHAQTFESLTKPPTPHTFPCAFTHDPTSRTAQIPG